MATSGKLGVICFRSVFWQEQSQQMPRGHAMLLYVFTWAQYGPALGRAYSKMREAAARDGSGSLHTCKVSVSGMKIRLVTSVHQFISNILC